LLNGGSKVEEKKEVKAEATAPRVYRTGPHHICKSRAVYYCQAASQYYVTLRPIVIVVCLSVMIVSPAKTAEPIEMPFWLWT